jgi:hypothetical protein
LGFIACRKRLLVHKYLENLVLLQATTSSWLQSKEISFFYLFFFL